MRLQGCSEDAVTLQVENACWLGSVVPGAQQFSNMTCAVDLGVNINGFQNSELVGLYGLVLSGGILCTYVHSEFCLVRV